MSHEQNAAGAILLDQEQERMIGPKHRWWRRYAHIPDDSTCRCGGFCSLFIDFDLRLVKDLFDEEPPGITVETKPPGAGPGGDGFRFGVLPSGGPGGTG